MADPKTAYELMQEKLSKASVIAGPQSKAHQVAHYVLHKFDQECKKVLPGCGKIPTIITYPLDRSFAYDPKAAKKLMREAAFVLGVPEGNAYLNISEYTTNQDTSCACAKYSYYDCNCAEASTYEVISDFVFKISPRTPSRTFGASDEPPCYSYVQKHPYSQKSRSYMGPVTPTSHPRSTWL